MANNDAVFQKTIAHTKAKLTNAEAAALGRAVYARVMLEHGSVTLVCVVNHRRHLAVCSAWGSDGKDPLDFQIPIKWMSGAAS